MVFPRPAGLCLCGHSSSSRCRLSVAWGFLAGNRLFEGSAAPAAAAAAAAAALIEFFSRVPAASVAVRATAAVQQLAASQQLAICRRFQKGRSGLGKRIFWTPFVLQGHGVSPSGRAVPLWAQQQQSLSPLSSMEFPCRKPPFEGSAAPAAAAAAVINFFSRVPAASVAVRATAAVQQLAASQ